MVWHSFLLFCYNKIGVVSLLGAFLALRSLSGGGRAWSFSSPWTTKERIPARDLNFSPSPLLLRTRHAYSLAHYWVGHLIFLLQFCVYYSR